jgi:signal transduction histidine kinase
MLWPSNKKREISIMSDLGKGAQFTITIPKTNEKEEQLYKIHK